MNIENPISKTTENIIKEENTLKEKMKFIAMNRFKIVPNREKDFENIWKNRETHLNDVSGFIEFHLVKGNSEETHTVYASHSTWRVCLTVKNEWWLLTQKMIKPLYLF